MGSNVHMSKMKIRKLFSPNKKDKKYITKFKDKGEETQYTPPARSNQSKDLLHLITTRRI